MPDIQLVDSQGVQQVLRLGQKPHYHEGEARWRNGREAGAFLAGIVQGIPEHQAIVSVTKSDADGAVLAMVAGGLTVTPYMTGGDDTHSFDVRVADIQWGPDPEPV